MRARLLRRPHEKGQRAATIRVPVELAVLVEALERRGIRVALVERAQFIGGIEGRRDCRIFASHTGYTLRVRREVRRP